MTKQPSAQASAATGKLTLPAAEGFFGYYPGAVAVITTRDGERVNVMSAGWHTALSQTPPLYGVAVAPGRHSHGLLMATMQFGVNFLPFETAEAIAGAGLLSGADTDKFGRLDLSWQPGEFSGIPVLDAAYMTYECRVSQQLTTGDHTLFVGEVLGLTYREEAYSGRVQDSRKVPAVTYYGRSTYEELGSGRRKLLPPELYRNKVR